MIRRKKKVIVLFLNGRENQIKIAKQKNKNGKL